MELHKFKFQDYITFLLLIKYELVLLSFIYSSIIQLIVKFSSLNQLFQ